MVFELRRLLPWHGASAIAEVRLRSGNTRRIVQVPSASGCVMEIAMNHFVLKMEADKSIYHKCPFSACTATGIDVLSLDGKVYEVEGNAHHIHAFKSP